MKSFIPYKKGNVVIGSGNEKIYVFRAALTLPEAESNESLLWSRSKKCLFRWFVWEETAHQKV